MALAGGPIDLARFAAALVDLSITALQDKAAEIRNARYHLRESNEQLARYAAEGDEDCAQAIRENEDVLDRMEERLNLLRAEVESRGALWVYDDQEPPRGTTISRESQTTRPELTEERVITIGLQHQQQHQQLEHLQQLQQLQQYYRDGQQQQHHELQQYSDRARISPEELIRRLTEQMRDDDEEGIHL